MMERNKPLNLGFQELKAKSNLVAHAEFRSIQQGIGMVISFAKMQSSLFCAGQPYRTKESRILRILRGRARVSLNLVEYEVKEQMIFITPPNSLIEVLELHPDSDFQVIVTENDFLPAIQGNIPTDLYGRHETVLALNDEEWKRSDSFFSLLWDSMLCTPFRSEVAQHLVLALLNDLKYIHQKQTSITSHLSRQDEILRHFITLISEHARQERTISFYADKLFLTPHYLSTVIRDASGQTVMQWINQAVIQEAKVLLKHSDLLIFQISDQLNFPNPSFFSKFFKRMTGLTPAEYQKKN